MCGGDAAFCQITLITCYEIFMLLYDSLSLVINAFSHRDCWGHGSEERKSIALQQLDCVARTMHQCAVFWVSYFAT